MTEFVKVLSKINFLILLDTYSAGEKIIKGATSKDIYLKVVKNNKKTIYVKNINKLDEKLAKYINKENTIIFMGAGSVSNIAKNYYKSNE